MQWKFFCLTGALCLTIAGTGHAELRSSSGSTPVSDSTDEPISATPNNITDAGPTQSTQDGRSEPKHSQWYGLPILGLDLASVALTSVGIATASSQSGLATPVLLIAGAGTFAFGSPIVHLAHDNSTGALLSFGLRAGLPVGSAALGYALVSGSANTCSGPGFCGPSILAGGVLVGFAIGAAAASAIDIGLLARTQLPTPSRRSFALAPMIDPKRNLAGMSVQGTW
jgi:hypothetical protein